MASKKKLTPEQIESLKEMSEEDRAPILEAWGITPMDDETLGILQGLIKRVDGLEKKKTDDKPPKKVSGGIWPWSD